MKQKRFLGDFSLLKMILEWELNKSNLSQISSLFVFEISSLITWVFFVQEFLWFCDLPLHEWHKANFSFTWEKAKLLSNAFNMILWEILSRKENFELQKLIHIFRFLFLLHSRKPISNSFIWAWAIELVPWTNCVDLVVHNVETSCWIKTSVNRFFKCLVSILICMLLHEIHQSCSVSLNLCEFSSLEFQTD